MRADVLLTYVPGTHQRRGWQEFHRWIDDCDVMLRVALGKSYTPFPRTSDFRKPEERRLAVTAVLSIIYGVKASANGATGAEVVAVINEHLPAELAQ